MCCGPFCESNSIRVSCASLLRGSGCSAREACGDPDVRGRTRSARPVATTSSGQMQETARKFAAGTGLDLDGLRRPLACFAVADGSGQKHPLLFSANQIRYRLVSRGIEDDLLLPWCAQHGMPVMAYSPLGGNDSSLVRDPTLTRIGAAHDCSAAAVALARAIRSGDLITIPESGAPVDVKRKCRSALTDPHAAGSCDIGCSASA
jgi:hypothetical protein